MKVYSLDFRCVVINAYESGEGTRAEVAEQCGVGTAFVKKLLRWHRAGESVGPKHGGGAQAKLTADAREKLRVAVATRPDAPILIQASSAARCSGRMVVPHKSTPKEETWMNFYTQNHKHYCGIDLHARAMYLCILDENGTKLVHKNLPTTPEAFLRVLAPYREDVVVGVECMFTWYWLADLCAKEGIAFVLGHALYMKAIHGGKAKNDKIDAQKIAVLLRGGMMPQA